MIKFYFGLVLVALVLGAYWAGKTIAQKECRASSVANQNETIEQIINNERKLNEKVFNTGTSDIRDILRNKYTIAD